MRGDASEGKRSASMKSPWPDTPEVGTEQLRGMQRKEQETLTPVERTFSLARCSFAAG